MLLEHEGVEGPDRPVHVVNRFRYHPTPYQYAPYKFCSYYLDAFLISMQIPSSLARETPTLWVTGALPARMRKERGKRGQMATSCL